MLRQVPSPLEGEGQDGGNGTSRRRGNRPPRDAWTRMLARGFRTVIQGVQMMGGDEPGYSRPDRYVLDDWR